MLSCYHGTMKYRSHVTVYFFVRPVAIFLPNSYFSLLGVSCRHFIRLVTLLDIPRIIRVSNWWRILTKVSETLLPSIFFNHLGQLFSKDKKVSWDFVRSGKLSGLICGDKLGKHSPLKSIRLSPSLSASFTIFSISSSERSSPNAAIVIRISSALKTWRKRKIRQRD